MSALARPQAAIMPMTLADLAAVCAIENAAYDFPWTRGNFVDSLAAGYLARVLRSGEGELLGYFVAMKGVDEMHLLNITVAAAHQRCGHARRMLDALVAACRRESADRLWLEVRESNERARELYRRYGFRPVGIRRGYYPALHGRREDADVMSLDIGGGTDALD